MANTYFKMLNNSVKNEFTNNIISEVQRDLQASSRILKNDIFESVKEISNSNNIKDFDINNLLRYYVLNQILKDSKQEIDTKPKYEDTANINIKKDKENNYYRYINNEYVPAKNIQTVNEDGSYITIETRQNSSFKVKRFYNNNDQAINVQILGTNNSFVGKLETVELLGLKKVYTQKFKYSGYSGESSDVIATVLNKICAPRDTDSYMDKSCNFYKWSETRKCFERNFMAESKSPLLTDYEFSNKIVIQKEYTGIR